MADILIRGMAMPEEGKPVAIIIRSDGEVWLIDWDNTVYTGYVACWPTTPMKASALSEGHGRLIDADAFEDAFIRYYLEQERSNNLVFSTVEIKQHLADMIGDWPTIIPAEGVTNNGN